MCSAFAVERGGRRQAEKPAEKDAVSLVSQLEAQFQI